MRSLRQLHAVSLLVETNRFEKASSDQSDYEDLLEPEDRLFVEGISAGSIWITLPTRSREAFRSIVQIAAIFSDERRSALIRKVQAMHRLKSLRSIDLPWKMTSEEPMASSIRFPKLNG
jgi:hypothetical protein